ncbi:MAG TPA: hypothetical protein VJ891_08495, partial [Casimicrobiaceae bacterium]|nr:hypothetical protein [Casimicrobiaceae bacterium]
MTSAWIALAASCAHATSTSVVDIPTRDATQRFLYVRPDAPVANIVYLPGTNGILGITNDGTMPTRAGHCGPFVRNRAALAARGFALALVDQTSDQRIRQFDDIRSVVAYLRRRDDVPIWIAGGSASSTAALDVAVRSPRDERIGLMIFSPYEPDTALAAQVRRPTLVVYNRDDHPAAPFVRALVDALAESPMTESIVLAG